jgi:hypothetical protein
MNVVEKRRAHRFPMTLPMLMARTEGSEESVSTRDVSSGGVYFEVEEAPHAGSKLEFVITLPTEITMTGPVQIRCIGKVVRVDRGSGQIGVAATIDRYEFLRVKDNKEEDRTPTA